MDPLISIQFGSARQSFQPGDVLHCDYQIDAVPQDEIQAVEASVLWCTEGKGAEDMDVHYFERRSATDVGTGDLRQMRSFQTVLPNSPLSYRGPILNVRWCVRVRAYLKRGRESHFEMPFYLGDVQQFDWQASER